MTRTLVRLSGNNPYAACRIFYRNACHRVVVRTGIQGQTPSLVTQKRRKALRLAIFNAGNPGGQVATDAR